MNDNFPGDDTALQAALAEIKRLEEALRPFADVYVKRSDPGTSDLDNEQPVAWHVNLGAYRRAYALTGRVK